MSLIGYARVSTSEGKQLLDRQVDALKAVSYTHLRAHET